MTCEVLRMDPLDKRRVDVDFSAWLGASSTIASVDWQILLNDVVSTGLTASDDSIPGGTVARNHFEAASSVETEYEIACTITTGDTPARKKTQRFNISVEQSC